MLSNHCANSDKEKRRKWRAMSTFCCGRLVKAGDEMLWHFMAFYSRAVLRSCRMSDMFCSCAQAQEIFLRGWGQYKEGTSVGGRIKFSLLLIFFKELSSCDHEIFVSKSRVTHRRGQLMQSARSTLLGHSQGRGCSTPVMWWPVTRWWRSVVWQLSVTYLIFVSSKAPWPNDERWF